MNSHPTARERVHLARIKSMPCSVCGAAGPSDAHHIKQHVQALCIPLCQDCHTGAHNGWHGRRAIWNVMRMDELDALAKTIEALV